MDQIKIGSFLRKLRKEREMTQSQLAEHFNVSDRTVSRWENGANMPDLSILVGLADFYDVDIREIINGERKHENMTENMKDTLEQVAEYSTAEKQRLKGKMMDCCIAAAILLFFACLLRGTNGFGYIPENPCDSLIGFATGFALSILVLNALFLSGVLEKIGYIKKSTLVKYNKRIRFASGWHAFAFRQLAVKR